MKGNIVSENYRLILNYIKSFKSVHAHPEMPLCSYLKMYLWWSSCTLHLLTCWVRVTVGDSGLCCCVCVTSFERCHLDITVLDDWV